MARRVGAGSRAAPGRPPPPRPERIRAVGWGVTTVRAMAGSWNIADLFEGVADLLGDREAVVAGGSRLTYADLDRRANRVAHVLAAMGVGPGDRVGLALRNGHEHLEALLGAYKLRAVPFNVNYRYTADEMEYL